jgi:hypothetical protein
MKDIMEGVKLGFRGISIVVLLVLLIMLCIYKVNEDQSMENKCYKSNAQIVPWGPKGLEVDSQGNIYISLIGGINVYDPSGSYKYTLKVKTYGTYEFEVDSNNKINVALAREGKIRKYNKEGYITKEEEDYNSEAFYEYEKNNKIKTDSYGNKYMLSNIFGNTKVVKTNTEGVSETIYKIPSPILILKLTFNVFIIASLLIAVFIFVVIKRIYKGD